MCMVSCPRLAVKHEKPQISIFFERTIVTVTILQYYYTYPLLTVFGKKNVKRIYTVRLLYIAFTNISTVYHSIHIILYIIH